MTSWSSLDNVSAFEYTSSRGAREWKASSFINVTLDVSAFSKEEGGTDFLSTAEESAACWAASTLGPCEEARSLIVEEWGMEDENDDDGVGEERRGGSTAIRWMGGNFSSVSRSEAMESCFMW